MADVQARTGRIREHVEHIEFGACGVFDDAIGMILAPLLLPFGLYLFEIVLHIGCFSGKFSKIFGNRGKMSYFCFFVNRYGKERPM